MRLFVNGIFSLLAMFLRGVSWPSVLVCYALCLGVVMALQVVLGRSLSRGLAVRCAVLSLYCKFIVAVTLLGRSPGLVPDASQNLLAMTYANDAEHSMDVAYNVMRSCPLVSCSRCGGDRSPLWRSW